MKFILDDVGVIAPHLTRYGSGMIVFDAGPYRDGTAIVDSGGAAFWVKDGTGYVVNDAARQAAPHLPQAPEEIRFDAAFITAAEAG